MTIKSSFRGRNAFTRSTWWSAWGQGRGRAGLWRGWSKIWI